MKRRFVLTGILLWVGCTNRAGERCNPMRVTTDCDPGLTCIYPTSYAPPPAMPTPCGVSFCCVLDSAGRNIDSHSTCQPDPESAAACLPDMGTVAAAAAKTD
jgi:hypothetical protein